MFSVNEILFKIHFGISKVVSYLKSYLGKLLFYYNFSHIPRSSETKRRLRQGTICYVKIINKAQWDTFSLEFAKL